MNPFDGPLASWLGDPTSWASWLALLKGAAGEPLSDAERAAFRELTNREPPAEPVRELWVIAGRRSGKSTVAAALAVGAALREHAYLRAGEVATVPVIAGDRAQARTVFRFAKAALSDAGLDALITRETTESIELANGAAIEITTASGRAVRGYTCPLIVLDEVAHWGPDDEEVLAALRPSQVTVPRPLLVAISSPYARRGALWETFRRHYGAPGPVLVARAPTTVFNPSVDRGEIDRALERDPAAGAAEWLAEFRVDVESFLAPDAVGAVTVPDRRELPPTEAARFFAFTDPSGGSRDSFTIAVAHFERDRVVLDAIRERRPPFSPESVVEEFAALLATYRVHEVTGDRYGGEWPRERFREHGIEYRPSESPKSDLYGELLPLVNAGRVELLDDARLAAQLCALERRTARGGRDSIDHAPGAHDDLANAVAGALVLAARAAAVPSASASASVGLVAPPRPAVRSDERFGHSGQDRFASDIDWRGRRRYDELGPRRQIEPTGPGAVEVSPAARTDRKAREAREREKSRAYREAMARPIPVGQTWCWERDRWVPVATHLVCGARCAA